MSDALYNAARDGDQKQVEVLVATGKGLNYTDSNGWTPLMISILAKHPLTSLYLARLEGVQVDIVSKYNDTALSYACAWAGSADLVTTLVRRGSEDTVNMKNKWGYSPAINMN